MLKKPFVPIIALALAQCTSQPRETQNNALSSDTMNLTGQNSSQTLSAEETQNNSSSAGTLVLKSKDYNLTLPFQKKTYDLVYKELKEGNLEAANYDIRVEYLNINEYEQRKHDDESLGLSGFRGLLWTFSNESPDSLVVQLLLDLGVDPNLPGYTWLDELSSQYVHEYTTSCNTGIAELLIKAGSKYALDGLMECAVNDKSITKISELLARGAKPDIAFKVACEKHDQQLFSKLIQAGGNIDVALLWAAEYEDLSMVKEMLDKGARIRETENQVSNVAYSENEELKNLLAGRIEGAMYSSDHGTEGAEPSSIMRAAEVGDYSAVEFMLKAGADPNNWCPDPGFPTVRSALECAESNGHTDVAELLKKYGAKKPQ